MCLQNKPLFTDEGRRLKRGKAGWGGEKGMETDVSNQKAGSILPAGAASVKTLSSKVLQEHATWLHFPTFASRLVLLEALREVAPWALQSTEWT